MRDNCLNSSIYAKFGYIAVPALLLMFGLRASADHVVSDAISSPDSASSPISPSTLSSSSRQKRAPGWAKRDGLEETDDDVELEGNTVFSTWDDDDMTNKRAPGWGKRAPGWGKRAPGWGKRAPGWGKRAPGWGKRSLDLESILEDEEDQEKRAPGWGKRAPGWGKRAPGWGKRAPGWGKRAPGWGKRAPGWGKRAPGWGKRDDKCQDIELLILQAKENYHLFCENTGETNEAGRK
ncbi:hypothetical protein RRG08_016964 [Elysia crispata]|uniref:APGWamide n=1 Tax=Elysia crispata TaxID=231223 RepID=A0AAE0XYT3_9GAST|nr:hypothetical protein RRG08_016964 [Elysia crispata]